VNHALPYYCHSQHLYNYNACAVIASQFVARFQGVIIILYS